MKAEVGAIAAPALLKFCWNLRPTRADTKMLRTLQESLGSDTLQLLPTYRKDFHRVGV